MQENGTVLQPGSGKYLQVQVFNTIFTRCLRNIPLA